jgi:hypothetical protein
MSITPLGKRRLGTLARRLEKLHATPKKKRAREFDMRYWQVNIRDQKTLKVCGTAACAFGEATFIPSFKRDGLYMARTDAGVEVRLSPPGTLREYCGYSAAAEFFGVHYDTAVRLFSPCRYPDSETDAAPLRYYKKITPKMVADRIRNVIANDGHYIQPVKPARRKAA